MRSRFDFEVVDTEFDKKLCIFWDDFDDYPDGIKDLPWDQTHRSMYNPDWDDAEDNVVHGKVDETCWHIDITSIAMFEDMFNTYVPSEYKPGSGDKGRVSIIIPDGTPKFIVQRAPDEVDRILDSAFSYQEPNAEYTHRYKTGVWDGMQHIYSDADHSAPVGLVDRAVSLLEDEGYDVNVTWENRDSDADVIDTEWNRDYVLRRYQAKAVKAVKDEQGGIVSLPTGTGKTITALKLIDENSISRGRTIVFVHTQELLYQWADEVRELLDVEPGLIGDGHFEEGPVTICIMQTLDSRGVHELDETYGQIIFDECHRTSAAETFNEIGMAMDCQYRVGLSATPWRRVSGEDLIIEGAIGSIVHEVDAETMIENDYLAEPKFSIIDPSDYGDPQPERSGEEYHDAFERRIEMDPVRNEAIAQKAAELAEEGHKVLINVNRIAQGRIIAGALNTNSPDEIADGLDTDKRDLAWNSARQIGTVRDLDAKMVSSSTNDRDEILEQFEDGELDVVVSTLLKEGVDIPDISAIILAHGQKSDIETIQTIGRALRPSNGDYAHIVDVKDTGAFFEDAFKVRQQTMRDYYGEYYNLDVDRPDQAEPDEQVDLTEPMTDEEEAQLAADLGFVDDPSDY